MAPNPNTNEQLGGWAEKRKPPPKIGRCVHRHTHLTELVVLIFFPKIWNKNMNLLTSPSLSLGVPQSFRPLRINYNPSLYCQWLQSSIIQKSLLQKTPQTVNSLLCFKWLINQFNQQVLNTELRSPTEAFLISHLWAVHIKHGIMGVILQLLFQPLGSQRWLLTQWDGKGQILRNFGSTGRLLHGTISQGVATATMTLYQNHHNIQKHDKWRKYAL